MQSLGIIGFGNMGESLAAGIRKKMPDLRISVLEKSAERRRVARETWGADDAAGSFRKLFQDSELVVLAFKPQDLEEIAEQIGDNSEGARVVSVLAGTTTQRLRGLLSPGFVARLMPSLAARVGAAVVGVSFSDPKDDSFRKDVLTVAEALGTPLEVPEKLMAAVTGISGSGLAFVFRFVHAMALGGVKAGLPYPQALDAALGVLDGAVQLIRSEGIHPEALLSQVISPAGTTIAGVEALEESGFTAAVMDAVARAAHRATELEG
jgi:pyrroline-5-carboxylate reductase